MMKKEPKRLLTLGFSFTYKLKVTYGVDPMTSRQPSRRELRRKRARRMEALRAAAIVAAFLVAAPIACALAWAVGDTMAGNMRHAAIQLGN